MVESKPRLQAAPASEDHGPTVAHPDPSEPPGETPRELEERCRRLTEELRLAQEEARRARAAAEEAGRARYDFFANMSHELRTPLNGIMGMAELTLLDPSLPPKLRTYQDLLKQSAQNLLELIDDLLDLARTEAGTVGLRQAPFDLRSALHSFLSGHAARARRKGLALRSSVDERLPRKIISDRHRLGQILRNVVGNAVKFTETGEITVSVTQEPGGPDPSTGRVRLLFRVTDTGIGMAERDVERIFEPFSQVGGAVHMKHGGTGLGLALSRRLVELMGGTIRAESVPGTGSTFCFTIEAAVGTAPEAKGEPRGQVCVGCLRILLAEDNPVSQVYARSLLEKMGHSVEVAADGRRALELLGTGRFDLILMDVRMPEIDGLEATRLIREGRSPGVPRDLPIVAVTAFALEGDRERLLAAGMDEYVSKPFNAAELARVLGKFVKGRR
ncbi:MAG: response regulator [Deltaproteobacteria bacterium]|nr:response regulator [Deltaproteobacteria bacterium]